MKKILILGVALLSITGCSLTKDMDNTPTKKVEEFLNKYQTLDEDVIDDLAEIVDKETEFSDDQKKDYKDIIKGNYQKLTYTIKDEEVDGDEATVTAEIEVIDYSKITKESNDYLKEHEKEFLTDDKYDEKLFVDYKLKKLKEAKEKVKYTIDFTLTKADGKWMLDTITEEIRNKINGKY
ncbi:MAG TPA: hypothetical protein PLV83_03945 [Bacilli bacterium]|nr:hypothetical protein [Bacilli bacterium]